MPRVATPDPARAAATPRRWWRALLITAVTSAALLSAGLAWLLTSERGNAWLLENLPGINVAGARGRASSGPFNVARIELQLGGRKLVVHGLAWKAARWQWRPVDGSWVGLTLVEPSADRIDVGASSSTATTALSLPASLRLPLALTLQQARVGSLVIEGQSAVTDLRASVALGSRNGGEHRVDALAFVWDRAQVQAKGSLAADAPFALSAQLDLHSRDGVHPPWQARLAAQGPLSKVAVQAQLGSAQAPGATLKAQASVLPFEPWPLASLAATLQDLDLARLGSGLPSTRLSGRADVASQSLAAPIVVRLDLTNALAGRWDQQRLPITSLQLELGSHAKDRSRLALRQLAVQLTGGGHLDGSGEWRGDAASLALRLRALRPELLDARAAPMSLAGNLDLRFSGLPWLDGSRAAAATQLGQASVKLDARRDAPGAAPLRIDAQARGERSAESWQVDLHQFDARSGGAHARATLRAERRGDGAMQLNSRGDLSGFDPTPWLPGAPSSAWRKGPHRLAGQWRAALQADAKAAAPTAIASLLALRGEAELDLRDSQVSGVPLQLRVQLDGRQPGWGVTADLRAADNRVGLRGRLAPRALDDRWRVEIAAPTLAALQPLMRLLPSAVGTPQGQPLAGALSGELQTTGRWPALVASGDLRATALKVGALHAARLQTQWQTGPDTKAPLVVKIDGDQLAFNDGRIDTLLARIEGSLADHRIAFNAASPLRPPAWTDTLLGGRNSGSRLQLRSTGHWQPAPPSAGPLAGRWRVQALELEARGHGDGAAAATPWLRAAGLAAQWQFDADGRVQAVDVEPGRLEALGAALRWTQAQWRSGLPAQGAFDAELEPLAIAPLLARLQPGADWGGSLTLAGHAKLRWGARFSADVVLERDSGDLTLSEEGNVQPLELTDLRLALAAQDGIWHFTQAVAGANLGVLAGAQSLRLPVQATWPSAATPLQGVLEWRVADLGAWAPFTPPGWRLAGALHTSAAFGGRFGAPEVEGQMTGNRLAVRNVLEGVDVRDGELALSLRGSRATVERFVFKGGDGELRLTGGASLGAEPTARLQLHAERFKLLGRFDRRIIASGTAALVLGAKSLALEGNLRVDEGLIDLSRRDAPGLDADVQVRGGDHGVVDADDANAAGRPASAPRKVQVAVQVDLGDELKLRGRGIDTRLEGQLKLTAPGGRLAVNGSVRTESGTYTAYNQKLAIERGVVAFSGPADNARLDILAVRPNLDVRVGVQIVGTTQNPRVRLVSEPEMNDADKLSWLMLGRGPDTLAPNDTALLQRAAMALLAGEGQGLDSTLMTKLGIDELSVRQIESGQTQDTVVRLGKQLSRRWYLGYEHGVNSTTGTWQLIYRIAQRFTLRAQSGEDNAFDAIWTWRWN